MEMLVKKVKEKSENDKKIILVFKTLKALKNIKKMLTKKIYTHNGTIELMGKKLKKKKQWPA